MVRILTIKLFQNDVGRYYDNTSGECTDVASEIL